MKVFAPLNQLVKSILPLDGYSQNQSETSVYKLAPEFNLLDIRSQEFLHIEKLLKLHEKIVITCLPGLWSPWSRIIIHQLQSKVDQFLGKQTLPLIIVGQSPGELGKYKSKLSPLPILSDPHSSTIRRYSVHINERIDVTPLSRPLFFVVNKMQRIEKAIAGSYARDYQTISKLAKMP